MIVEPELTRLSYLARSIRCAPEIEDRMIALVVSNGGSPEFLETVRAMRAGGQTPLARNLLKYAFGPDGH